MNESMQSILRRETRLIGDHQVECHNNTLYVLWLGKKRNTLVYYLEGHSSSEGATGLLIVRALLKRNLYHFDGKF